jgi:hypothetical protein
MIIIVRASWDSLIRDSQSIVRPCGRMLIRPRCIFHGWAPLSFGSIRTSDECNSPWPLPLVKLSQSRATAFLVHIDTRLEEHFLVPSQTRTSPHWYQISLDQWHDSAIGQRGMDPYATPRLLKRRRHTKETKSDTSLMRLGSRSSTTGYRKTVPSAWNYLDCTTMDYPLPQRISLEYCCPPRWRLVMLGIPQKLTREDALLYPDWTWRLHWAAKDAARRLCCKMA